MVASNSKEKKEGRFLAVSYSYPYLERIIKARNMSEGFGPEGNRGMPAKTDVRNTSF